MKYLVLGVFALSSVVACGGAAEPAAAPAVAAQSPITSASAAPSSAPAAPKVTSFADAESAARAFFDAISKHDTDAAVLASAEEAFARGQSRRYADVSAVHFDGPAKVDEWPGLDDASLFWATFTSGGHTERILLAVARDHGGWKAIGIRDEALRAKVAADSRPAAPPPPLASKGKLLSKPTGGLVRVELDGALPAVGDKVDLSRQVDPSIPLIGGSWLGIADTVVTAVTGKTVTLKILAQKSEMKINGKPLDHYTVGVPISVTWTKSP